MYSFPDLEPVCCSMSNSNCCFLNCIQVSQEEGKLVWYSHLFKNFPHFVVMHIIKGSSIVNKAEVYVFLALSLFFDDPTDVGSLISGSWLRLLVSLIFFCVPFSLNIIFLLYVTLNILLFYFSHNLFFISGCAISLRRL